MFNLKQAFKKPINKVKTLCTAASAAVVCGAMSPMVLATSRPTTGNNTTVDPRDVVTDLVEIVFDIFFYIGVLLLAWAIGMLVLAFKNEDADSKSRAMMLLVVACVLMGIRTLFNALGIL